MELIQVIGLTSFGTSAGMYTILLALLVTSWRGRLQGLLLVAAAIATVLWSGTAAAYLAHGRFSIYVVLLLELLRNLAWFLVFLRLLEGKADKQGPGQTLSRNGWIITAIACAIAVLYLIFGVFGPPQGAMNEPAFRQLPLTAHLMFSLLGAVLAEQLYRQTPSNRKWSVKYLCIAIGGMFAFDFYVYANSLLFQRIDLASWVARGFIAAMTAPLVAVSAARNPSWSVNVYVSRRMLFHSTTVLFAAGYLLLAAIAGYYVQLFGGSWGSVLQNVLVFAALAGGAALVLSRQLRERMLLFLATNFYQNKYEYGDEWLKFSDRLGSVRDNADLPKQVLSAIGDLMNSGGGGVWLREMKASFVLAAADNIGGPPNRVTLDPETLESLGKEACPVLIRHDTDPQDAVRLELPETLRSIFGAWLLVPLVHGNEVIGLLLLTRSLTSDSYNHEDRELLRAVARQAAGYLALLRATDELAQSRQFEAYNRFSAFLVHDLKNVIGQLSMVLANASQHRDNPEFFDDAMTTVDNATEKMKRVLRHLRERSAEQRSATAIEVSAALAAVVQRRALDLPKPLLEVREEPWIFADADRFESVIAHFVQNAQEATPPTGEVKVILDRDNAECLIRIQDNGCGMSPEFVRNQLFKPFQTTKGNAGMGIGVYEGREFARALGGSVEVDSTPGTGTVFSLRLPIDEPARLPAGQQRYA